MGKIFGIGNMVFSIIINFQNGDDVVVDQDFIIEVCMNNFVFGIFMNFVNIYYVVFQDFDGVGNIIGYIYVIVQDLGGDFNFI